MHDQTTPDTTTSWPDAPWPRQTSVEGYAPPGEWPNTVTVTTVSAYDPDLQQRADTHPDEAEWAADHADRQLVRVDTNYKPSRPGAQPVNLTRTGAVNLAAAVLEAIEDTFHYTRVGELRATEAAELLEALGEVDAALLQLREHTLGDLLRPHGIDGPTAATDPRY